MILSRRWSHDMTIDLPVAMSWGVYLSTPAEIVDIAPHITVATFAVHVIKSWRVTNIETGFSVCECTTRREAISIAKKKLRTCSNSDVLKDIRRVNNKSRNFIYAGEV
jgi:hypothetical protein